MESIIFVIMILALIIVLWLWSHKRLLTLLKLYKESLECYRDWKPRADEMIDRLNYRLSMRNKVLGLATQLNTAYDNQAKFLNRMIEDYKNGVLKVEKPENTFYTVHYKYLDAGTYNGVYTSFEILMNEIREDLRNYGNKSEEEIDKEVRKYGFLIKQDFESGKDTSYISLGSVELYIEQVNDQLFDEIYEYFKRGDKSKCFFTTTIADTLECSKDGRFDEFGFAITQCKKSHKDCEHYKKMNEE
jgi:hypothetical protein